MITAVRHYKNTTAVYVSGDRFRALEFKLEGRRALRLTATFLPPKPPLTQRTRWETAMRKLRDSGWEVRGGQLVHGPSAVPVDDEDIHKCVAAAVRKVLADLSDDKQLLRRYDALTQPGPATKRDLASL